MISFKQKGDFSKSFKYLDNVTKKASLKELDKYGRAGVEALAQATPKLTGKTSESWSYSIEKTKNSVTIKWDNSNKVSGIKIVILLQYGHMGRDGYYVNGVDFINPALEPIFNEMAEKMWKEITSL